MMDVQAIADWLESADYNPFAYSGRGMYGVKCLAISTQDNEDLVPSDMMRLGYWIGEAAAMNGGEHPATELIERFHLTDQLGRGIVVYWPALRWPEAEAE